ncbi:hypothetical protein Tco_0023891, partial [Tanacetum coccineum]
MGNGLNGHRAKRATPKGTRVKTESAETSQDEHSSRVGRDSLAENGQSIDVDAPPDIIDVVDVDDDIINEEDPIPHDLADS